MSDSTIINRAESLALPILDSYGMELVDIEYRREQHGWVLRLYIDKDEGVSLDDCGMVSRELAATIEVEELIEGQYNLEVSSPGLTRPLKKLSDFEKFKGQCVKVKCYEPLEGQKKFIGTISKVDGEDVSIDINGVKINIRFSNIAKANLEFVQED